MTSAATLSPISSPAPYPRVPSTKAVIARIDTTLLDAFLNWDHSSVAEVTEIKADNNEDWMTRILQSDAFSRIPPAIIQRLIISMQPFPVRAGEVVIRQGDEGDFFYSIHKGRCAVTRRASPDGAEELLSELLAGDFFGEESLVSATTRNASITMLTDGLLMRLAKKEFVELLQKPLVHSIGYEQAAAMVDEGAVWIDVRSAAEYESNAFEDSVNIPMSELRDQIPELVFNAKYIICCDTGHRSTSAAFILSHKGFEVYVLDGGLNGLVSDAGAHPVPTRRYDGNDPRSANIIACNQNGKGEAQDNGVASPESGMSRMVAEPHSAERLAELEALRCEVAALRQTSPVNQETGREVAEHKAQLGRLQDAIADSNRQLSELNSQLETETKEKHWLREQYAIAQKDFSEQLIRLERELDLSRALVR